jgi:hypothetical protein
MKFIGVFNELIDACSYCSDSDFLGGLGVLAVRSGFYFFVFPGG